MSAPKVPSPADLARRPGPKPAAPTPRAKQAAPATSPRTAAAPPAASRPSAADAVAPGRLTRGEPFRKYYLYGMRIGRLPAHARLVGHDLMWRADYTTGHIAPNRHPKTETLAEATGLTTGQVEVALQVLRTRGWLTDRRVTEGPRAGRSVYALVVPALALEQIRTHLRGRPHNQAL
ncbi:hypothetical protein ABZ733_08250 [Streptomyces longwoodensis]|uniref:hypothetical protein n=1 Tax=Streptomyces longwoodensis TaxID=68231 RepID=UPI0033E9023B